MKKTDLFQKGFALGSLLSRCPQLLILLLFAVALVPRLVAIDRVITPDELTWVFRSIHFREALLDHRWADTSVAGHPGVTTTWLGALGIGLQLIFHPADGEMYQWLTHLAWMSPDLIPVFPKLAHFLTAPRIMVALVTSLGVVGAFFLAQALFGRTAAFLGAFLLALDPFLAGLSGLLHVDGLAATFTTLSLLALGLGLTKQEGSKQWRYFMLSGAMAGLSALTKSPTLLLLPFSGLALFVSLFKKGMVFSLRFRRVLFHGALFLLTFLVIALVVFPAFWTAPERAIGIATKTANRHADDALRPTFFMGKVSLEHGVLFYPISIAFRLSPLVLLGLCLALYMIIRADESLRSAPVLILLLWGFFFLAALTPAAKKFDRYALPVIPSCILVAAVAWDRIANVQAHENKPRLHILLAFIQSALLALVLPYPLAAYNPLVGGNSTAVKVVTIGWGDNISAAARWIAGQPGADRAVVAADCTLCVAPFNPGRTVPLDDRRLPQANYIILGAANRQLDPEGSEKITSNASLVHTVRISGLDYAWVYRQDNPAPDEDQFPDFSSPLSFDNRVQLLGANARAAYDRVALNVRWALQSPGGRYNVQLVLRDEWGHTWGKVETILLNSVNIYPEFWADDEVAGVSYSIELPAGIPPAGYILNLALFDADTGARLPLRDTDGAFHGVVYSQQVAIPQPDEPVSLAGLYLPEKSGASWLDNSLTLLGYKPPSKHAQSGDTVDFDLFWLPHQSLPDGLSLRVSIGDLQESLPISRAPSGVWKPEILVHEKYSLAVPPGLPAGQYALQILPTTAGGEPLDSQGVALGQVQVAATERLYELPGDIPVPLDYVLGGQIHLRGVGLGSPQASPGQTVNLTLYWQAEEQPEEAYTVFIHLIAPDGSIPAQADRWPANSATDTWAPGQVIIDEYAIPLPENAPTGGYQVAAGLYLASGGVRLPITDANGAAVPGDRLVLPVTLTVVESDD